jgi:hypothetical protein
MYACAYAAADAAYYASAVAEVAERPADAAARRAQTGLLRCLFSAGRAPRVTGWLTPTVTGLAVVAYEQRALPSGELDAQRLAVLADALEDAGCSDADLPGHLRGPGPHVRGCWALDTVLGKE